MHFFISLFFLISFYFTLLNKIYAFDLSKDPFKDLNLNDNILGIHSIENKFSEPPSTIISSWFILMKKNNNDAAKIGNGCPDDSTLCGIIKLDNNDNVNPIQLFSVSDNNVNYEIDSNTSNQIAKWNSISYGDNLIDVILIFECNNNDNDVIEIHNNTSPFISKEISISWKNKQFCKNDNDNNNNNGGNDDKNKKENDKDSGLGFFGTTFLIGAVAFAGYLVAQAWYNASTIGSSNDFFNELVDISIEGLSSIPRLVLEVINKITGSASNSSRGGYSAV